MYKNSKYAKHIYFNTNIYFTCVFTVQKCWCVENPMCRTSVHVTTGLLS